MASLRSSDRRSRNDIGASVCVVESEFLGRSILCRSRPVNGTATWHSRKAGSMITGHLVFMEEVTHGKKRARARWNATRFGGRIVGAVVVGARRLHWPTVEAVFADGDTGPCPQPCGSDLREIETRGAASGRRSGGGTVARSILLVKPASPAERAYLVKREA